ncbi:hypothetical protein APHAL10511_005686 [Amanita phalloides]|nr:hypothetical protein APHAL10511_005686 [Amanita phalloides]
MTNTHNPPRAPPIKYAAPLGTRWAREKAAAGGATAFDFPTDPKSIGPWILGECVGKGASGRVKIAKHRRTGQLAAVKILPIAPLINSRNSLDTQHYIYEKFRLGVDREITMMKLMNHPNIMRIYDVFEGEYELFLVLEYVEGGELFDFLVNRGRLLPQEAQEYFKQIIYGLNYAHTFSIIHRDLKPENILIASFSPPLIKIADWGMAAFAPPTLQLETSCGSPHYASPEIVNGEKYQGGATDIWSCGVVLYALLTGRLPFDDKDVRTLLSKVKSGKYEMPAWIDPLAKNLISRMLVVEVAKRITIPEILAHPWLTAMTPQTRMRFLRQPTPPLPPSPSTLARPIASSSLIDPELFSSLRIIWGRHADAAGESIKRELCSPVGQGVYTKAFYYLLGSYREESYRKRLVDGEEADDCIEYNGVRKLRFDRGWRKSDACSGAPRRSAAPVILPSISPRPRNASRTAHSNENPRQLVPLPLAVDRSGSHGPSKERPTLPVGPRPIPLSQQAPCKVAEHHRLYGAQPVGPVRPASSIIVPARRITLGTRPLPPPRGYTFYHQVDEEIAIEEKLVEGRRNTVLSITPSSGQGTTMRESRIPSPTFQGNDSPVLPRLSPDLRSARLQPAQTKEKHLLDATSSLGNALSVSKPSNSVHARTQLSSKPPTNSNRIQDTHIQWQMRQDAESKEKKLPQISIFKGVDKENQDISTDKSSNTSGARRVSGVGLGMAIGNARQVCQEMGNVIYIGTGNTPVTKVKKERKGKPPALDLPTRRTTLSALGSPTILSSPIVGSNDVGSPNRILTSPIVGEFKGWFSSLFNWKHNANGSGQSNILYSPDGMSKTCGDVGRLLEALGVIVLFEKPGENPSGNLSMTARLKCRVEELSVDPQTNTSLKPVRFRVEFMPIQQTRPLIRHSLWSPPLSPITDNACFFLPPDDDDSAVNNGGDHLSTTPLLSAPNPGLTPRVRMSMLPAVMRTPSSGQNTPMPSPGLNALQMNADLGASGNDNGGSGIPFGTLCGILLFYEKGSTSSFKTIWRRLKDVYCGSPTKMPALQSPKEFEAFSPMMASTPTSQAYPKGQFMNTGC